MKQDGLEEAGLCPFLAVCIFFSGKILHQGYPESSQHNWLEGTFQRRKSRWHGQQKGPEYCGEHCSYRLF